MPLLLARTATGLLALVLALLFGSLAVPYTDAWTAFGAPVSHVHAILALAALAIAALALRHRPRIAAGAAVLGVVLGIQLALGSASLVPGTPATIGLSLYVVALGAESAAALLLVAVPWEARRHGEIPAPEDQKAPPEGRPERPIPTFRATSGPTTPAKSSAGDARSMGSPGAGGTQKPTLDGITPAILPRRRAPSGAAPAAPSNPPTGGLTPSGAKGATPGSPAPPRVPSTTVSPAGASIKTAGPVGTGPGHSAPRKPPAPKPGTANRPAPRPGVAASKPKPRDDQSA